MSAAARKAIEMHPEWEKWEKFFSATQRRNYQRGVAKGEAEGRAKGVAAALLTILTRRRLTLSAKQKRQIGECTDLATLQRWLEQSLSASSVEDLLAPRTQRRVSARNGAAQANGARRKSRRAA